MYLLPVVLDARIEPESRTVVVQGEVNDIGKSNITPP